MVKTENNKIKPSYAISKNRYRELKYFCLQYIEKKEQLSELCYLSAVKTNSALGGTGISKPTETQAERILQLQEDLSSIEQTAIETNAEFYSYIIENVTRGIPWEYLDVPMSRRSFYYERRKFFYLLSLKK